MCRSSSIGVVPAGKPVLQLARAATAQAHTGRSLDDPLAEQRWRTPLITTAYAHMEMIADSRLSGADRLALIREVPAIFRARWLPRMQQHEAAALRAALPAMLTGSEPPNPCKPAGWHAH